MLFLEGNKKKNHQLKTLFAFLIQYWKKKSDAMFMLLECITDEQMWFHIYAKHTDRWRGENKYLKK